MLSHPVYIVRPKGIKEFGFLSQEECGTSRAELTRAMHGNTDSPLQWMKTFSNIFKGDTMKMQQSATDPCISYKQRGGKIIQSLFYMLMIQYVKERRKKLNGRTRR
jgi:hypothetical protein